MIWPFLPAPVDGLPYVHTVLSDSDNSHLTGGRRSHPELGLGSRTRERVLLQATARQTGREIGSDLVIQAVVPRREFLGRQLDRMGQTPHFCFLGPILHGDVVGNGDGREDPDDHDDDHQLDERETVARTHDDTVLSRQMAGLTIHYRHAGRDIERQRKKRVRDRVVGPRAGRGKTALRHEMTHRLPRRNHSFDPRILC